MVGYLPPPTSDIRHLPASLPLSPAPFWTSDLATLPFLMTSGGHHWRPIQTCSLEKLSDPQTRPPPVLTSSGGHRVGDIHLTGMLSWFKTQTLKTLLTIIFKLQTSRGIHPTLELEAMLMSVSLPSPFFQYTWSGFLTARRPQNAPPSCTCWFDENKGTWHFVNFFFQKKKLFQILRTIEFPVNVFNEISLTYLFGCDMNTLTLAIQGV